jgi:beta-glucosidase-like glycosyl hydrolase
VDQSFCDSAYYGGVIEPAIASGEIQLADVDRAVSATLTQKFAAGLFDGALPDPSNRSKIYTDASRALARRTAAEGAVLLRNAGGARPLKLAQQRNQALLGTGVQPDVQSVLIQRLAQRLDLRTRDLDVALANLTEILGSDDTGEKADDDHHHQKLQQSEAGNSARAAMTAGKVGRVFHDRHHDRRVLGPLPGP